MKTLLYILTLGVILYLWYFIFTTFQENLPTEQVRMCQAEGGEWQESKCIPRE